MVQDHVTRYTPLPFEIELTNGSTVTTVGDIETYLRHLTSTVTGHRGADVRQRHA
jgi:hypothetical protein